MTIEEALADKIEALATAAAGRIYRDVIEQAPDLPAIAISRIGGGGIAREAGGVPMIQQASIVVGVVDRLSESAIAADALRAGLDGWRGVQGDVTVLGCFLRSQREAPEIEGNHTLRVVLQDYEIKFR